MKQSDILSSFIRTWDRRRGLPNLARSTNPASLFSRVIITIAYIIIIIVTSDLKKIVYSASSSWC